MSAAATCFSNIATCRSMSSSSAGVRSVKMEPTMLGSGLKSSKASWPSSTA